MEADATISEESAISSAESELPDMVPVSIRSSLPELQHHSLEKVLAGLLLTWEEFLQLFDIRLDPDEYFIRGTNGVKSDLTQKIGDYVSSLKRKMKTYPVTLERVNGTNDANRNHRLSTNSEDSSTPKNDGDAHSSFAFQEERDGMSSGYTSKKLKLLDTDSRSDQKRRAKESLEKIAQTVIRSPMKRSTPLSYKPGTKHSTDSRSPSPPNDTARTSRSVIRTSSLSEDTIYRSSIMPSSGFKMKRLSTDSHQKHRQVKDGGISLNSTKESRKKQKSRIVTRRSTNDSEVSDESSETDDDVVPCTKDKKKILKQSVLKYLNDKVSARSMLQLRKELMGLREREKYFKVTSVVPMTAGMMEQTFCRNMSNIN